jgi:hypothetical protein
VFPFGGARIVSMPSVICIRLPVRPEMLAITEKVLVTHVTSTVPTLALVIVPLPPATVQTCHGDVGWAVGTTLNAVPLAIAGNANAPPVTLTELTPSLRTRPPPLSPETLPLTTYLFVVHATFTLVTFAPPMVPLAPLRAHVCVGPLGCVFTVTA